MPVRLVLPSAAVVAIACFGAAYANTNFFPPEIMPPKTRFGLADPLCMQELARLQGRAARNGLSFLNVARERREPRDEMCKLARTWAQSELAIVRYVEMHADICGLSVQSAVRFIQTRSAAESVQAKVCAGDDSWMVSLPAETPRSR